MCSYSNKSESVFTSMLGRLQVYNTLSKSSSSIFGVVIVKKSKVLQQVPVSGRVPAVEKHCFRGPP